MVLRFIPNVNSPTYLHVLQYHIRAVHRTNLKHENKYIHIKMLYQNISHVASHKVLTV